MTLSSAEYTMGRQTRRKVFLEEMDSIIPWGELVAEIRSLYYGGKRGRKPIEIETMMRMYFLQN